MQSPHAILRKRFIALCRQNERCKMEATLTLNFSGFSNSISDILNVFGQIGWSIFNPQGMVEYLPKGDNDEYNWQCRRITAQELHQMISEKAAEKETVGVNLFYDKGAEGVSMLARSTDAVVLSICINRRCIIGSRTDTAWYLENIVYALLNKGVNLLSYQIEEYAD